MNKLTMNNGFLLVGNLLFFFFLPLLNSTITACTGNSGPIWVTTTEDAGAGSLREAIDCANSRSGPDTIQFNIVGTGPRIIYVGSSTGEALPALLDPGTVIDGSTQAGYGNNNTFQPLIILDGSRHTWTAPINALWIRADQCEIYALEIHDFPDDGIDITQANFVRIGAPGKGNVIYANGADQDFFPDAPNTGPWEGCGIVLKRGSSDCIIQNNILGTDYTQGLDAGNEYCGIIIRNGGDNNLVGGPDGTTSNVIAHNAVAISIGTGSTGCGVRRNVIYCNDTLAIDLRQNANNNFPAPAILQATRLSISGTATVGALVDVYSTTTNACVDGPCQGRIFLGTATAASNGTWVLNAAFALGYVLNGGEIITAIATDAGGNSSAFADCRVVAGNSLCTQPDGSIVVTSIADEGVGTLRAAIECANATPGANTIVFNIAGIGPHRIMVGSTTGEALPALLDISTIIDGSTQPGFGQGGDYSPFVILDGSGTNWDRPINAVWVRAPYCQIFALEIVGFPDDAIDITGVDYVVIGAPQKGNVIYGNGWDQDYFPTVPNTGPWNGCGIVMKSGADRCRIQSNILGTNYNQSIRDANEHCGIVVLNGGDNHLIGGTGPEEGNTIAYHKVGIRISNGSYGCSLRQNALFCNDSIPVNLIGNANYSLAIPQIDSASTVHIGGSGATTDVVEVFLENSVGCDGVPCQGRTYLGRADVVNGEWSLNPPFAAGFEPQEGEVVTATATDTLGNTSVYSTCVAIVQGCALEITIDQLVDASCGNSNGSFEITVSGGSAPLTYMVNDQVVMSASVGGLDGGNYTVIVTDTYGCADTTTVMVENTTGPEISLEQANDASCGLPNGLMQLSATGGTAPYTYDIGNGPQAGGIFSGLSSGTYSATVSDALGCNDEIEVTLGDSPAPFMSVSNIVHASCDQSNGSFSVTASGGTAPYSFDIGNGATTDTFFNNLSSGLYSVTLTDHNSCASVAAVTISDIDIQPDPGFSYSMQGDMVNFTNTSSNGVTYDWDFGDNSNSNELNPVHIYPRNDNFMVCLTATNACGSETYCETIAVVFPLIVNGLVTREDGQPVAKALFYTGGIPELSGNDGLFEFNNLPAGPDYDLTPGKDINWTNGLTTFDIYLISQHILDVSPLTSPYQLIAADANNSGTITTFDVYRLRQLILGSATNVPGNTSWRFVPASYQFINPSNPFPENFPESINLLALDRHMPNQDFIGIKTGDINLSGNPLLFQQSDRDLLLRMGNRYDETTEILTIDVRASSFSKMAAMQFDLQFDPSILAYEGLLPADLPGINASNTGLQLLEQGLLPIAWSDPQGRSEGASLADDALLFQLQFRVLAPLPTNKALLSIIEDRSMAGAYEQDGELLSVVLEEEEILSGVKGLTESHFQLLQNEPNPFGERSRIRFYLPESAALDLKVMSVEGKVVRQRSERYAQGWQVWDVERDNLAAGIYWYVVEGAGFRGVGKMVVE